MVITWQMMFAVLWFAIRYTIFTWDFFFQFGTTALLFLGLWQSGNRRVRGPFMATFAEALGVVVGVEHHVWSLIAIGGGLFFLQLRNYLKWRKDGLPW